MRVPLMRTAVLAVAGCWLKVNHKHHWIAVGLKSRIIIYMYHLQSGTDLLTTDPWKAAVDASCHALAIRGMLQIVDQTPQIHRTSLLEPASSLLVRHLPPSGLGYPALLLHYFPPSGLYCPTGLIHAFLVSGLLLALAHHWSSGELKVGVMNVF